MTTHATVFGIVAALLFVGTVSAHAGPCAQDIAELETAIRGAAASQLAGPTGPQSIGAQLGRQPTPDSVRAAEAQAEARLGVALARARVLDAQNQQAECAQAVRDAQLLIGLR